MIYETQGDLDKAVEYREQFLDLCKETNNKEKQIEAHKLLAETFSRADETSKAIKHLNDVLSLCNEDSKQEGAQADAALKLGLLYYKPGPKHSIKSAAEFLGTHFTFIRHGENDQKNSRKIDLARVNLGIVKANMQIKSY